MGMRTLQGLVQGEKHVEERCALVGGECGNVPLESLDQFDPHQLARRARDFAFPACLTGALSRCETAASGVLNDDTEPRERSSASLLQSRAAWSSVSRGRSSRSSAEIGTMAATCL